MSHACELEENKTGLPQNGLKVTTCKNEKYTTEIAELWFLFETAGAVCCLECDLLQGDCASPCQRIAVATTTMGITTTLLAGPTASQAIRTTTRIEMAATTTRTTMAALLIVHWGFPDVIKEIR